jgi:hypothetical protein
LLAMAAPDMRDSGKYRDRSRLSSASWSPSISGPTNCIAFERVLSHSSSRRKHRAIDI